MLKRSALLGAALVFGAAAAPAPKTAAPVLKTAKPSLPGDPLDLKTRDGWILKAMLAPSMPGKMTLILLHDTGRRKEDWKLLALPLARAGYGVLAVDLRGHGASLTSPSGEELSWKKFRATRLTNDYANMSRDAEAAVAELMNRGVPEDSIGFVGAEVGGSIAIRYAAVHPKVPLVVMLSPGMAWQEVLTVNALRALKRPIPTPVLMVYAAADKRSAKETPLLHAFARGAVGDRHTALIAVPKERGTRMFQSQRSLVGQIIGWIGNPIAPDVPSVSTNSLTGGATSAAMGDRFIRDKILLDGAGTKTPALAPIDDSED